MVLFKVIKSARSILPLDNLKMVALVQVVKLQKGLALENLTMLNLISYYYRLN